MPTNIINIMRFFILILCLSLPFWGNAQEERVQRFKGGVIGGFSVGQVQGDEVAGFRKFGLVGGGRVAIVLKDRMEIGVEMLFSQKGSAENRPEYTLNPFSFTMNYVEVPVLFNYMDWMDEEGYYKLHFHGGLSYGRLISYSSDINFFDSLSSYFKDNDLSWIAGATYYVNERIGITGRYSRSLIPFFNPNETTPNAERMTTLQISFHTVYMF